MINRALLEHPKLATETALEALWSTAMIRITNSRSLNSNMVKAATARPTRMHKEEGIDTTKMPVILTPNKQETHTASRLQHKLRMEGGDRNKAATATGMHMVRLPGLQDMVSST